MAEARLAVWGDPIAHSKSPALHAAAYARLGLDWQYGRRRVTAEGFGAAIAELDGGWRGLSLTMPLKEEAFRAATTKDRAAELTGAVNTLRLGKTRRGFNTDIGGIVDALVESGIDAADSVRILGAGATAASALVAAAELGATHAEIRARRPERAAALLALGGRLGIVCTTSDFTSPASAVDLTLATLPSGTVLDVDAATRLVDAGGALFEAAYAPWPSVLAGRWEDGAVVSGMLMLLHQAIRQVRVFVHGDPEEKLDDDAGVLAVMRRALVGD